MTFSEEALIEYGEAQLEDQYPEFAALMREYEEGILLFEVTKLNVWDKASQDTTGLREYFNSHRDDYMWPERALVVDYRVTSSEQGTLNRALSSSAKYAPVDWAAAMNKREHVASFSQKNMSKDKVEELGYQWQEGWTSAAVMTDSTMTFTKVQAIEPPTQKELAEAKGYVIADYQDYLEEKWIEELRKTYEVKVNEHVVDLLIDD